MKLLTTFVFVIIFTLSVFAQPNAMETLATASGRTFTAQDLTPQIADAWIKLPTTLSNARKALLEQQIEQVLLRIEAGNQKISVNNLLNKEVSKKVPDPTAAEVKKLYDANKDQIGEIPFEKIRPQIVTFLREPKEKKAYQKYVETLKKKHKIEFIKDVNSNKLVAGDVLVTVGAIKITYFQYFQENGLTLYEYEANVFDMMKSSLEQVVDSAVYTSEAQSLGIATSDYIAREITNKLKTYSDEETEKVQSELRKKLYPKYRVKFFVKEPKPFIQKVSADDDPSNGNANAPVTVVMFTDFQCPACAATYPVLKDIISQYGNRVRLVVRDFPLTKIHENAFQAAIAANAARNQGKYFEFKEILYKNQKTLDTESLKKLAAKVGLNVKKFENDLKNKKFADEIRKDIADGKKYGVSGTPSIFVNGYKIRGLSAKSFRKAIERALKQ